MTEKRFTLAYDDDWWAVREGEITLWKEEVVDLLNSLNEENKELKFSLEVERQRHKETYKEMLRLKAYEDLFNAKK